MRVFENQFRQVLPLLPENKKMPGSKRSWRVPERLRKRLSEMRRRELGAPKRV